MLDRFVQQLLLQVMQPLFEPIFSESSHGFRPGRSAQGAIEAAQRHAREGRDWVVDMDITKFFDQVNHDILMTQVSRVVRDKRVLQLIGRFLRAGIVLPDGCKVSTEEGTPQGGPLSPLLANIYLDKLDKELERRGLKHVRYADDCNIYVSSEHAAKRVLENISQWISRHLRLQINAGKERHRPSLGTQVPGLYPHRCPAHRRITASHREVQRPSEKQMGCKAITEQRATARRNGATINAAGGPTTVGPRKGEAS